MNPTEGKFIMTQDKIDLRGTKILVVDDVSANVNVLYEALTPEGYEILAAPSGEVALKIASRAKPDLILLDIMMPGIDGFETCRRLKADESTADITIIFVTARGETESIVEGFQIGGVDYIVKPFQHEEVRARVRTHLTIKRLQDELREANTRIEAQKMVLEQELQDARHVQMSLMPDTTPPIEGIEIAGKCVSANTVSGDFFDYLEGKRQNEVGLVIADVTGKAMKGAMNAVMVGGVLYSKVEEMDLLSPGLLMAKLNNVLKIRMERDMNVTMVIGVVDVNHKAITIANAGHHAYPLLLRLGDVQQLRARGMPLGMMKDIEYTEEKYPLKSGDIIIFMTDGIIEAIDSEANLYSDSGRLEQTISQFTVDMSAEAMVGAIINDAIAFSGDKESRDDDMTVVAAKIQ